MIAFRPPEPHHREHVILVVERLVSRWAARDTAGASRLFAERVRWWTTPLPVAPWPHRVRDRREVESFFLSFHSALELSAITTRDLVVDRSDAVLTGRLHLRVPGGGTAVSQEFALAVTVRDGLVVEFRLYLDTLALNTLLAP
ncbi:nuclear transport factor 2 family protein [Saccharothrix sp. Mg75]|uniref:nuclear transport factor 2 family protein n=1 Tax=Saccharothrix sp. Mg75 TaxID=3445357 RepID=UPI003EEFD843